MELIAPIVVLALLLVGGVAYLNSEHYARDRMSRDVARLLRKNAHG